MKDFISTWAAICESLDEEKRIEKILKKDEEKEEKKDGQEVTEKEDEKSIDDMTDDELLDKLEKEEPSYEDIEILAQKAKVKSENPDDVYVMSQEEYDALSDDDKHRLHAAAHLPMDITMSDVNKVMKDPKEFLRKSDEFIKDLERRRDSTDWNEDEFKYTWVIENEIVYEPSNEIEGGLSKDGEKSLADKNEEKYADTNTDVGAKVFYSKIVPGKYILDNTTIKEFTDKDDAKSYVAQRMRKMCEKFNIRLEDFEAIHIKQEQKNSQKSTSMISGIPMEILREDPDAIGFLYRKTEGKSNNNGEFSKIDRQFFLEYFIYSGDKKMVSKNNIVKFVGELTDTALDK